MSFFLAHSWSAFVLAKGDRHGANKNEITIFVFSVTAKDFSHVRAPGWKRGDPLRVRSLTSALVAVNSVFRIGADRQRLKHVPRSGLTALPYRVQGDEGALCHCGQCADKGSGVESTALTDLPDPLSPTIATLSPCSTA